MLTTGLIALVLTAASATPETPLAPLAFVTGHCWRGTLADGKSTDTHCFEALLPPHFLRDRHEVCVGGNRVYAGETTYSPGADGKGVNWRYLSSTGLVIDGQLLESETFLRFVGAYVSAKGTHHVRATWTPRSHGYQAVSEARDPGGNWARQSDVEFVRVDGAAGCAATQ
jgi:hypothetical protein